MWSYYGRKAKIAKRYPAPKYDKIIEPFAGTAAYSMLYWEHDVELVDNYYVIVDLWHYLQQASPKDIEKLPVFENGQKMDFSGLTTEEAWLVGFCSNNASSRPAKTSGRMNFNSWFRDKHRIASDLYKIKHWKITLGSFVEIPNQNATWFIDPPYSTGGQLYTTGINFSFDYLGQWSKQRLGQTIVCENGNADWLPFSPLVTLHGQRKASREVIWTNES